MIFHSPYPDISIEDIPWHTALLRQAETLGTKPALVDGPTGRTITYAELVLGSRLIASSLAKRGMRKGDVFAILSPNIPEYAVVLLAVSMLGGISTTINPLYTADEVAYQLNDTGATYLVTIPHFIETAKEAASKSKIKEIFVFGEAEGATPLASLLASDGQLPEVHINPAEDLVFIPYSSGTTGIAKGVMLTHRSVLANIVQADGALQFSPDDKPIAVLPFYHIYGLTIILSLGLYKGGTLVTVPRFDLEQFLHIMRDQDVTVAPLVPPIVLALAKHPIVDGFAFPRLRFIGSGAAPLSDNVQQACSDRLHCPVIQGYGMTETSAATHIMPMGRNTAGSVGVLLPSTECKVADVVTGAELGPNERGEICVRGPQNMKGYLNRPDATAAMIDRDGWLHTGDVGYADDEGYFFVVDRVKELIKYKGLQVAPAELEAVLLSHPGVADAAVIGSPDEEAGEVPKAFVVLKAPVAVSDITDYVAQRVAPHKKIRRMEIVEAIPKSASGKILRRLLVERERQQTQAG